MREPRHYRRYDYAKSLLPNVYLASLEEGVETIDQAKRKTGLTVGYPGWGLIYHALMSHLKPRTFNGIVETGTNQGCSTIVLAQALKDSGCTGKVYSVEINPEYYSTALDNIRRAGLDEYIEAKNCDSRLFLQGLRVSLTKVRAAFLDASHLYQDVIEEFELLLPMLESTSLVIFDNTSQIAEEHEDQRVHGALRELVRRHGGNLINFEYVSWYTPGMAIWQLEPFAWG